jgi:two-component system invasion response regulator UvrY
VRVVVVDDQDSFRSVMCELVEAAGDFELAGTAASGEEAVQAVAELSPDLVIMDKRMPGIGGIEACRRITQCHPEIAVLICSVEEPNPGLAEGCGASAIVRKQDLSIGKLVSVWRAAKS